MYDFVFIGGKNYEYIFETDYNLTYIIKFKPSPYLITSINDFLGDLIFEFVLGVLENQSLQRIPTDPKIGITVANILNDFFNYKNETICVYICESKDKKQELRMKKFDSWFRKFQDTTFLKLDEVLIDNSNNRYPISIIFKNSNPYRNMIFEEFIKITNLNFSNKQ